MCETHGKFTEVHVEHMENARDIQWKYTRNTREHTKIHGECMVNTQEIYGKYTGNTCDIQ